MSSTGFPAFHGTLADLPAEVVLEIIPRIAYSPIDLLSLCLTCRRFNSLVSHHQISLVRAFKSSSSLRPALRQFPGLPITGYADLRALHRRLARLDALHARWLHITSHGPELAWLRGRWETIHKAGLLLLYRLHDCGSYEQKTALLASLPATSLACLLFKLGASVKILRVYGPDPIRGTFAAGDVLARSDVELACEEMLLVHGPEFFLALLHHGDDAAGAAGPSNIACSLNLRREVGQEVVSSSSKVMESSHSTATSGSTDSSKDPSWAAKLLTYEVDHMIARQLPDATTGAPPQPTLTSCLRRAFAARHGGHFADNAAAMWETLASPAWDRVDEDLLAEVAAGEPVPGGFKRMGVVVVEGGEDANRTAA